MNACLLVVGLVTCDQANAVVDLALRLETSLGTNSNLLREPIGDQSTVQINDGRVLKTSLRQSIIDVGAGIHLGSDETRLVLTTQLTRDQFSQYPELGHTSQDMSLQLPWRFGTLWEGNLIRNRQRNPFTYDADYRQLDLVTQDTTGAVLVLKASPSFSFPLIATVQSIRHDDQVAHGQFDEDRRRVGAAARYSTPDGNAIQIGQDRFSSTFLNRTPEQITRLDDGYKDTSTYLDVLWNASAKTRVSWRIAARQRHHNLVLERDNSVTNTRLTLTHLLSPKTRFDVQVYRQAMDSTGNGMLYTMAKGLNATAGWAYSPQTQVTLQVLREAKTDIISPNAPLAPADNPTTMRLGVRLQHKLTRGVSAYIDAGRERLTQARRGPANQTVIRVGVDYSFENMNGAQNRTRAATLP